MRYCVILRATSYVRFKADDELVVPFDGEHGHGTVTFRSLYRNYGLEHPLPDHLIAVVEGEHTDLKVAAIEASNQTNRIVPILAFIGNGRIYEALYHFAYDASEGVTKRRYVQFVEPNIESAKACNRINSKLGTAVINALAGSPHRSALYVTMTQYALALREWSPGYEIAAVAHLFMAMEALKGGILERELTKRGLTRAELAAQWGVKTSQLENEARLRLIFKGDTSTHSDAKDASNAYEHGDNNFGPIYQKSYRCRDASLKYLREAIIDLLNLDGPTSAALSSPPLTIPPAPGGMIAITGELPPEFDFDEGASVDFMPFAVEESPAKVELDESTGTYTVTMTSNWKIRLKTATADGTYHMEGTNLVSAPTPAGVIRANTASNVDRDART